MGMDLAFQNADGILGNSATSATLRFTTSGDLYLPSAFSFVTELYAPKINQTKTVTDLNGGNVEQGDTLEYKVSGTNNSLARERRKMSPASAPLKRVFKGTIVAPAICAPSAARIHSRVFGAQIAMRWPLPIPDARKAEAAARASAHNSGKVHCLSPTIRPGASGHRAAAAWAACGMVSGHAPAPVTTCLRSARSELCNAGKGA